MATRKGNLCELPPHELLRLEKHFSTTLNFATVCVGSNDDSQSVEPIDSYPIIRLVFDGLDKLIAK